MCHCLREQKESCFGMMPCGLWLLLTEREIVLGVAIDFSQEKTSHSLSWTTFTSIHFPQWTKSRFLLNKAGLGNCDLLLTAEMFCSFPVDVEFLSACLHDCILSLQTKAIWSWCKQVKGKPKGEPWCISCKKNQNTKKKRRLSYKNDFCCYYFI